MLNGYKIQYPRLGICETSTKKGISSPDLCFGVQQIPTFTIPTPLRVGRQHLPLGRDVQDSHKKIHPVNPIRSHPEIGQFLAKGFECVYFSYNKFLTIIIDFPSMISIDISYLFSGAVLCALKNCWRPRPFFGDLLRCPTAKWWGDSERLPEFFGAGRWGKVLETKIIRISSWHFLWV